VLPPPPSATRRFNRPTYSRYAKLARQNIARTGSTAREMWKLLDQPKLLKATTTFDMANILSDVRV